MKVLILIFILFAPELIYANSVYFETNFYLKKYFDYDYRKSRSEVIHTSDKLRLGISCNDDLFFPLTESVAANICVSFFNIKNVKDVLILNFGCKGNPVFVGYFKLTKNNIKSISTRIKVIDCNHQSITVFSYLRTIDNKIYAKTFIFMPVWSWGPGE